MSFVLVPLTLVYVAVSKDKSSEPSCFVVLPETFVFASVRPELEAVAVFLIRIFVKLPRILLPVSQYHPIHKL